MNFKDIIEKVKENYPQLPQPKFWEGHAKKRYYFNNIEDTQDYTFFLDLINNKIELRQKPDILWHKAPK